MSMRNHESHVLYKSAAEGAPPGILDRNGAVVLNMCRHCGKTESELIDPCEKVPKEMTQKMVNDRDFAGCDTIEEGWKRSAETFPEGIDENNREMLRAVFYSGAMYAVQSPCVYAMVHEDRRKYYKRQRSELHDIFSSIFDRD